MCRAARFIFPIVTLSIIIINFIVFVLELINGDAFVAKWSLLMAEVSSGHHVITILTAMFMHASWSHILGNMVFLWAFGPEIEDAMGPSRYAIFYLAGGIAAMSSGRGCVRSTLYGSQPRRERRDRRGNGRILSHISTRYDSVALGHFRLCARNVHFGRAFDRRMVSGAALERRFDCDRTDRRRRVFGSRRRLHLRGCLCADSSKIRAALPEEVGSPVRRLRGLTAWPRAKPGPLVLPYDRLLACDPLPSSRNARW